MKFAKKSHFLKYISRFKAGYKKTMRFAVNYISRYETL